MIWAVYLVGIVLAGCGNLIVRLLAILHLLDKLESVEAHNG